jgi:hypothetical protein
MKRFHPVGTVVTLINGTKPIMIYGRLQQQGGTEKIFDYVACLYPEGHINNDYNIFFNNEEIAHVLFVGYQTPEDEEQQLLLLESLK